MPVPATDSGRCFQEVGLTDRLLDPSEARLLLRYGVGLTDVVKVRLVVTPRLPSAAMVRSSSGASSVRGTYT
jgi:hypothetical protein